MVWIFVLFQTTTKDALSDVLHGKKTMQDVSAQGMY